MSKERELLNRARYNLDREYCADLIDEIDELLAQPEPTAEPVDNAVYTVSWHEKKHRDDNWEVRRHIVSNPELIKMFLTFNKQLSELIFGKNIIWGLQMQEGEPTKEYDLKLCKTKEVMDYLAQPEHITFKDDADKIAHLENSVELLACLLYTKKREPLSDETVGEILMGGFSTYLMDLVRMIEKAHGIGGGE